MISRCILNKFCQYLLITLIILDCRSIFIHTINTNLGIIFSVGIPIVLVLIILLNFNCRIKKKSIMFIISYILYILVYYVISVKYNKLSFINIFFVCFPLLFLIFSIYKKEQIEGLFKAYVNIIIILSCISLFYYFFGSLFNVIKTNVSEVINWGGYRTIYGYNYLHFNAQTTIFFDKTILRNTGIFVEGPMFALHLMIAMALSLFLKKKLINKYSIIFGIAILSTLSITGILFYLFSLFYKFTFNNKNKIKIIMLPIVFFVFLYVGMTFFSDKQGTNSYNIRNDDFIAGFSAFKENVFWGNGFLNNNEVIKYMSDFRKYNTGLSNSFIIILVHGGIYLVIFYLLPIILIGIKIIFTKHKNLFLIEIIALQTYLFFTNAYQYTVLMLLFIAFDYYVLFFYKYNNEFKKFLNGGNIYEKI